MTFPLCTNDKHLSVCGIIRMSQFMWFCYTPSTVCALPFSRKSFYHYLNLSIMDIIIKLLELLGIIEDDGNF